MTTIKGRGRRATTPIILPDGREVLGWQAAEIATGHRRTTMLARATWDNEIRAWRVREAGQRRRRMPGTRYDRLVTLADAVREWRASWEVIDDATAAVERRRVARERMFAALNALDEAGQ
jgi:hypothetical protein